MEWLIVDINSNVCNGICSGNHYNFCDGFYCLFFSTGKIFSKGFIYSLLSQCAHKQYQYYTIHNVYGIMFYRHISDEQTPVIQ